MNEHQSGRISAHLQYHWWQYVLLVILSIALWTGVFDTLAKPEKNQQVGIVFLGDSLDTPALHSALWDAMDTLTDQDIQLIDISQTLADSANLGSVLMARCYDSDLLILTGEQVDALSAYGFFTPLSAPPRDVAVYTQDTDGQAVVYGLEIYTPDSQNRFSSFCSSAQTYYVFLSKESVNLAGLNGNGAETDDAALKILEYLLEEPYETIQEN